MRIRTTTTGAFLPDRRIRKERSCGGSFGGEILIGEFPKGVVDVKTIKDVFSPGFQALKKCLPKATLPFNPLVISTVSTDCRPGVSNVSVRPTWCSSSVREDSGAEWIIPGFALIDPGVPDAAVTSVVNAACADARSAMFDALTFAAEAHEIGPLFATQISRITTLTSVIRRKAKKIARAEKKSVNAVFNNLWLEYRYAWTPLILSLDDGIKAFKEGGKKGLVRGRGSQTFSDTLSTSTSSSIDGGRATLTVTESLDYLHIVRGCAYADFSQSTQSTVGLDPIVTAYELMKFSFVLDWFIQIGTWITATSPFQPGKIVTSGYSIKSVIKRTQSTSILYSGVDTGGTIVSGGGTSGDIVETTTSYTRDAKGPSFPGWNPKINIKRSIDAWALINGLIRAARS